MDGSGLFGFENFPLKLASCPDDILLLSIEQTGENFTDATSRMKRCSSHMLAISDCLFNKVDT